MLLNHAGELASGEGSDEAADVDQFRGRAFGLRGRRFDALRALDEEADATGLWTGGKEKCEQNDA